MLKSASLFAAKCLFDFRPISVSILICQAKEDDVSFFREKFRFLCCESQIHVFVRVRVLVKLLFYNIWSSQVEVDVLLGLLDFLDNFFAVMKSINFFKENCSVGFDLCWSLGTLHMLADVCIIISGIQFQSLNELLIFSSIPVNKTF